MAVISAWLKKNERWSMLSSSRGTLVVPLPAFTSSYSWWGNVTLWVSLASRSSLFPTGTMDGELAPPAISATASMNRTFPHPSHIVWLFRTANMKPLHVRRITCSRISKERCLSVGGEMEEICKMPDLFHGVHIDVIVSW